MMICVVVVVLLVGLYNVFRYFERPFQCEQEEGKTPIERFIQTTLEKDGKIETNDQAEKGQFLSESLGLWMTYLVRREAPCAYQTSYEALQNQFLLPSSTVSWEIQDEKRSSVNASIDDLRIVQSLYEASEKFDHPRYAKEGDRIARALVNYQWKDDVLVDFYDATYQNASEQVTLSYYNVEAFQSLYTRKLLTSAQWQSIVQLMTDLPMKGPFYPKMWENEQKQFVWDDEVNIIDQAYISLNRARLGLDDPFYSFVRTYAETNGKVEGRFHRETVKPSVSYESPAVYALLAEIARLKKDAYRWEVHLTDLRNEDGLFIDRTTNDYHSFDHLLVLLSETR